MINWTKLMYAVFHLFFPLLVCLGWAIAFRDVMGRWPRGIEWLPE